MLLVSVLLPCEISTTAILSLVMYFFAALGVQLYGGLITRDPSNPLSWLLLENGTDFTENEYWANNFNDMISAMNVLFNLLVCSLLDRVLSFLSDSHDLALVRRSSTTGQVLSAERLLLNCSKCFMTHIVLLRFPCVWFFP